MDKELRNEVKNLIKKGFPENLAIITACANQKKPEMAEEYLLEIVEEHEEMQTLIKYMIPFEESLKIQEPPASEPEPENTITVIHHDIEEPTITMEIIKPEDPPYRLPVGKT
jgi:hypothetical protein